MHIVEYSVLSYYPSFILTDSMTIGLLFHCVHDDQREFVHTSNWNRLKSFDDELNLEFVKAFLKDISNSIEPNLLNTKPFNLKEFTKFYVNEYKFSKVHRVEVGSAAEFIETSKKIYLKYDYKISDRTSKREELNYLKTLLQSSSMSYKRDGVEGSYDDKVSYDYIINNNIGIKLFTFTESSIHHYVNQAKIWAFNAAEMANHYKTVITYIIAEEFDYQDNQHFKSIIGILKDSKVEKVQPFDEFLKSLNKIE